MPDEVAVPIDQIEEAIRKAGWPLCHSKADHTRLKPGMYLQLYHGYASHDDREAADDWGANGPVIGPLKYVHTTYAYDVKILFISKSDVKAPFKTTDEELIIDDDCLKFMGYYFGDWSVFTVPGAKEPKCPKPQKRKER